MPSAGGTLWDQVPQRDPFPRPDAVPYPGCDVCAALVRQRAAYRRARDASGVTDCNVELRRHPHGGGA